MKGENNKIRQFFLKNKILQVDASRRSLSVSRSTGEPADHTGAWLPPTHLVGGGRLLAVDAERHQARGQIDQAADLQVHVAAAGGVSGAGSIAAPNHVAVAALHTGPAQKSSQSIRQTVA